MKKYIIGGVIVVLVALYVIFTNQQPTAEVTPTPPPTPSPTPSTPTPTPTPTPSGSGTGYKDGGYTGPVEDAFYGKVQVKAVISHGKITDIQFLQFPNAPGHTTEVNNEALPQLKQEAIAAQSAQVDTISGATQTSEAFTQSLAAALQQAQA